MSKPSREFTWVEGLAFCLAWIGIQLCSELLNQFGAYFYSPPEGSGRVAFVSMGVVGIMFFLGAVCEGVTNPLVGLLSDRTRTMPHWRFLRVSGRRRPWIFWGSVLMAFTLVAVWYPPNAATSPANFRYGTFMLCLHWLFFSMTSIPILALAPEVATSTAGRLKLGIWVAVGSVLGLAVANGMSGEFLHALSPPGTKVATPEAYRKLAVIYAVVAFFLFQFLVWTVRERFHGQPLHRGAGTLKAEARDVTRNRPFLVYWVVFLCFNTGLLASQRSLPYWSQIGLGGSEQTLMYLMLPFILACLATYPFVPMVARRIGIKWTVFISLVIITTAFPWMYPIATSAATSATKINYGALLFAYAGIGQGISFVMLTPLIGEIVDFDFRYSGERREALYNGLTHLSWKVAQAISILLATQSMNLFGSTAERPYGIYIIGPIAGCCGLLGCFAMLAYPSLPVARSDESN